MLRPLVLLFRANCATTIVRTKMITPQSLPDIVQAGAPVLRAKATDVPVEKITTPEFQALIATMIDVMRKAPGVGLAAPQIGISWRVFVLEDRDDFIRKLSD